MVFVDGMNAATTEYVRVTRIGPHVHEGVRLVVESAQCAHPRPKPQRARPILIDGADVPDPHTSRASRIIPVVDELLRRWIETAETVNLPHPQLAASILIDAQNVVGK